jgi:hypothetical protein
VEITRAWEGASESTKTSATDNFGYYELKQCKPWFDEVLKIIRSKELGQIATVTQN